MEGLEEQRNENNYLLGVPGKSVSVQNKEENASKLNIKYTLGGVALLLVSLGVFAGRSGSLSATTSLSATGQYLQGEHSLLTDCFGWPEASFSPENSVLSLYGQQPYLTRRTGDPAVDFTMKTIDGEVVNLKALLSTKPVVMIFGMYTCPVTHATLGHERNLTELYGDDVHFLHIYSMDPHPESPQKNPDIGRVWEFDYSTIERPNNYTGRLELAKATAGTWGLNSKVIVDEASPLRNNPLWCTYGPSPRSAHLIRQDGIIQLAQTWFDGSDRDFVAASNEMADTIERTIHDNYKIPPLTATYGNITRSHE